MSKTCISCDLLRLAKALVAEPDWGDDSPYKYKHTMDEAGDKMRHKAFQTFHAVLDLGPKAELKRSEMLTFSEGTSNKFHFFCIFEDEGEWKAGNAYGRIGGNVSAIEIARGSRMAVESAYGRKIRSKRAKGYA